MAILALVVLFLCVIGAFCFTIAPAVHVIFLIFVAIATAGTLMVLFDKETSLSEKVETIGGFILLIILGAMIDGIIDLIASIFR